mgnify:CR=1 FL=1
MAHSGLPELPDFIAILAGHFKNNLFLKYIYLWEYVFFAVFTAVIICLIAYFATRKLKLIPNRLQNAVEYFVEVIHNFVCGILGPKGSKYFPFIATLFVYILFMNLLGLVPFFKSATSSLSTTFALAICVFIYLQYTAIKEHGFFGYLDHLAGSPRGAMAFTVILPVFMLFLHILSELIRPVSLSMRLRGNIWGDEILLAIMAGFGLKGLLLLFFSMLMSILKSIVQAAVFVLLTTIYFALILKQEEEHA